VADGGQVKIQSVSRPSLPGSLNILSNNRTPPTLTGRRQEGAENFDIVVAAFRGSVLTHLALSIKRRDRSGRNFRSVRRPTQACDVFDSFSRYHVNIGVKS
jgi:hypothetical protein